MRHHGHGRQLWPRVRQALEGLDWSGQIVIDATNGFEPRDLNGGPRETLSRPRSRCADHGGRDATAGAPLANLIRLSEGI